MGKAMKREVRQCSSCGGFCKKSGCERENVPIITSSDVIAGLQMALSQAEAMIVRQLALDHIMGKAALLIQHSGRQRPEPVRRHAATVAQTVEREQKRVL